MEPGEVVGGKYKIVRLLGAGGMGSVYEAQTDGDSPSVALKVINSGDLTQNTTLVQRFQREARAASTIDTPHIVKVVDAGVDDTSGMPFMAMELLRGEDAQQLIDRLGQLPPALALKVTAQACVGLHKAHEARVVHRDIKPANLYVSTTDDGAAVVKVLDFGVAKVKMDASNSAENAGLTRTGSMLGSPLYMSPEQARGHKTIDHRADIWSLGVVLYQMLCAKTPHHDIDALGELIIAICSDLPAPIQDRAPWVEAEVAAIVHRALRFDPADRFQTAEEMLGAIIPLVEGGKTEITQAELVGLPAELRTAVGARLSDTDMGMAPPVQEEPQVNSARSPATMPPPSTTNMAAATNEGVAQSHAEPPRKGSSPALILLVAAVVGVGGFFAYRATQPPESTDTQAPVLAAPPESEPSVEPQVQPSAEKPPRTVKVVVLPSDATVEIGGEVVPAKNGVVEITGALGSLHKIKISKGDREAETEVVIAEAGAIPPKVELPPEELSPPGGNRLPKKAPDAPPPPPPPPPPTGAPEIDTEFN